MDLGFQAKGGQSIRKKNPNRYPYSTNKLYINQDQYTKSLFLNRLDAIIYQQRQKTQDNIVS